MGQNLSIGQRKKKLMKVQGPMHSIDARGKMDQSFVFSIWRGLNYIRTWALPSNPQSTRQGIMRAILTVVSKLWGGLSDANRLAWRTAAEGIVLIDVFGKEYSPSGFNYYCALGTLASDQLQTPLSSPPIIPPPSMPTGVTAVGGTNPGEIDVGFDAGPGVDGIDVWIAGPLTAGRNAVKSDFRHKVYLADDEGPAVISGLTEGLFYSFRVRSVNAGGQSSGGVLVRATPTVTP